MSEIKKTIERYNWDLDEYMIRAYEADDGKWVAYEDVADLITENERLRAALADMLAGWRYVRETHGDLSGVGWDRAEAKARNALKEDGR
jgi:tRNA A58 N-methylase Trm61